MILIAYYVSSENLNQLSVPAWEGAVIVVLAMMGLLFAISCPMVVMRIARRVTDNGWMKLAICLTTIALSAIWPVACMVLVG